MPFRYAERMVSFPSSRERATVHRTVAMNGLAPVTGTKKSTPAGVLFLVPVTGIEPVRILLRGILSPLCLPVPPHRRGAQIMVS